MPLFCIRTSDSSFFNSDESHYFILCPKKKQFFFSLEENFFITVPQVAACIYENFICKENFFIETSQVAACICKKKKKNRKKVLVFLGFLWLLSQVDVPVAAFHTTMDVFY